VAVGEAVARDEDTVPPRQRSRLAADLGRRFVAAVDIELPRGHDLTDLLAYARQLSDLGIETLMLSDALRARLVVHPLVVAYRLQHEIGMECVLPFHARDKNILGIQSDLLAAHVLGVANLFVSLSDPANLGDYPHTRTLGDLGADGLVRVIAAMTRGLDLAENPIGAPTAFVPLVRGDPHAPDPEAEAERLERQVESGALAVVTPPQYDMAQVAAFCERLGPIPVLVGVLPVRSFEHAEYLNNEVPGIRVPAALRQQLRSCDDPSTSGLGSACDLLRSLPGVAAGAHVLPPYRKHERVCEALEPMRWGELVTASHRAT